MPSATDIPDAIVMRPIIRSGRIVEWGMMGKLAELYQPSNKLRLAMLPIKESAGQ
jgi:hypothetical protein